MEDLNDKITGNDLTAVEWNQLPSEIQNVIEGLGQTLSNADLNQLGKGIAGYVANGNHYTDSGAADAYIMTQIGSKQASTAYTDGMIVEFVPANSNAGASTINVAGLGVKDIANTSSGGEILSGTRISLRYNSGSGEFDIFQTAASTVTAGLFFGLKTSNAADADHDITIATGQAADSTNTFLMALSSAITKQIDGAWAVGTNQPGLFTGTVANNTWYYMFIIRKDSDGTIDAGFDISESAANIPSGYTAFRRVGAVRTNGSANILQFQQHGDDFRLSVPINFFTSNTLATARTALVVTAPPIDDARVIFYAHADNSTTNNFLMFTETGQADTVPTSAVNTLQSNIGGGSCNMRLKLDGSSQIFYRANNSGWNRGADFITLGWEDNRGK